jgi:hypothetical protein
VVPVRNQDQCIVCDTLDYAAAQSILRPITRLPLLASCAIRLGQLPNHGLRRLAESTARQVTGLPPLSVTVFPWDDLPPEIQLRILGYSGILAPQPINWTEDLGPETPLCCRVCTETLETCCCPTLHAAWPGVRCQCWSWPQDHFRVDKKLRQQALQIFYSLNTFSISVAGNRGRADGQASHEYQSALVFLRSTPRDALEHIRSLRIVFSSFSHDDLHPGTRSLTDWIQTRTYIRDHLVLARLNLTLCTLEALKDDGYVSGLEEVEWGFYQRLSGPTTILQGLQSLSFIFPPTLDPGREVRNRVRERELPDRGPTVARPSIHHREGPAHPQTEWDEPNDGSVFGPADLASSMLTKSFGPTVLPLATLVVYYIIVQTFRASDENRPKYRIRPNK